MPLTVPRIPFDENSIPPAIMVGYDGGDYHLVYTDADGNLQVRNMVYDAHSMDWIPQEGGSGVGTDVNVINWPASLAVTGPLTNAELRLTPVSIREPEENKIIYESADGNQMYMCWAPIGTAKASAAWKIKKIDFVSGTFFTWCDGNNNYDNTATDLATVEGHSYS